MEDGVRAHDGERHGGEVDLEGNGVNALLAKQNFRVDVLGLIDGGGDNGCGQSDDKDNGGESCGGVCVHLIIGRESDADDSRHDRDDHGGRWDVVQKGALNGNGEEGSQGAHGVDEVDGDASDGHVLENFLDEESGGEGEDGAELGGAEGCEWVESQQLCEDEADADGGAEL
jgi:hypothetical protein